MAAAIARASAPTEAGPRGVASNSRFDRVSLSTPSHFRTPAPRVTGFQTGSGQTGFAQRGHKVGLALASRAPSTMTQASRWCAEKRQTRGARHIAVRGACAVLEANLHAGRSEALRCGQFTTTDPQAGTLRAWAKAGAGAADAPGGRLAGEANARFCCLSFLSYDSK